MHQSKMMATSGQVAEKGPVGKEFQDIHCLHMVACNPHFLKNISLSRLKKTGASNFVHFKPLPKTTLYYILLYS